MRCNVHLLTLNHQTSLRQDFEGMPQSLLSYFTASKSRAAACERLLLEKPEGVKGNTASNNMRTIMGLCLEIMDHSNGLSDAVVTPYEEDVMTNWPFTFDAEVMKLDERLNVLRKHPNTLRFQSDIVSV